jgi:hypothetical protein
MLTGPLHIQCNGYGDPKYLNQLVDSVCGWPHIESTPAISQWAGYHPHTIKGNGRHRRLVSLYRDPRVCSGAARSPDDLFSVTSGLRSLGHCAGLG